jgi:RHS repeat-associated protein
MNDASGATVYTYDERNRLSSKQTPFGTLSYTYNDAGNLLATRSSNANGASLDYAYDVQNRLSTVKDNHLLGLNGGVTSYSYDAAGNLQAYTYPNGVTTSYVFNSLNRLTTMTVGTAASSLAGYSYTLGAAGNRTAVTELSGRTVNYIYDDLYRLTSESIANDARGINGSVTYGYDPVGNRLSRTSNVAPVPSQSSSYDANDRLTSDTYDDNGNTITATGQSYAYDFENHLTSLNGGSVTYVYDGDGNRVAKTAGGVTTNYLVDTNNLTGYAQVVEEIQSGAVTKQFSYGHDLISQRIIGSSVSFYGYDGHGSVRLLTDAAAAVTDTYDYDAFGNLISRTGTTPNDYLYSGEQFDASLGFYYLRARYMSPSTGRFLSSDSFEGSSNDPASLHKYLYAKCDPENRIDPSGKVSIIDTIQSVAISSIVFVCYNTAFHSTLIAVGTVLNLAAFVSSEEYAFGAVSATPGGPAAFAEGMVEGAVVTLGVARSITNVFIASGAAAQTPSEIAASFQGSIRYPGVDRFRNIVIKRGTFLICGDPGCSGFFTTERTIARAGGDSTRLFEGLQVAPHQGEYRHSVIVYEALEDCPGAFGIVRENPQYGEGGFPQVYVPNWQSKLRPVNTINLENFRLSE